MHEHTATRAAADTGEPMIDARQAAVIAEPAVLLVRRPHMRAKHRIPHYRIGGLVRFRLSELAAWARQPIGAERPPMTPTGRKRRRRAPHDGFQRCLHRGATNA